MELYCTAIKDIVDHIVTVVSHYRDCCRHDKKR